jgi:hypothetical protein
MHEPVKAAIAPPRELRLDVVLYQNVPGGWELRLNWTTLAGGDATSVTGIQVYKDAALREKVGRRIIASANGPGEWSQSAAGFDLVRGTPYWIAVTDVRDGREPVSNAVPVLWEPMRFVSLACDGRVLDLGWQPPPQPFSDYEMGLYSPSGKPLFGRRLQSVGVPLPERVPTDSLYGARVPFDALPLPLLDPRLPFWMRQVYSAPGSNALALGPIENAQSYVKPPVLLSARYVGGDATTGLEYLVRLQIPGDDYQSPTFSATVTADGRTYASPVLLNAIRDAPDTTWAVKVLIPPAAAFGGGAAQVAASTEFAVQISRADPVSVGPAATMRVLTRVPAVTGAVYSADAGGQLAIRIAQPEDSAAVVTVTATGAGAGAAVVTGTGAGAGAPVTATVQGPRGVVALAAVPGVEYVVTAAAAGNGLLGPAGGPVGLLTEAPKLETVRYDGAAAFVMWSALQGAGTGEGAEGAGGGRAEGAGRAGGTGGGRVEGGGRAGGSGTGVTGYAVRVSAGGSVVAETVVGATATRASVPVLAGDVPLTVSVSALALSAPDGATDAEACVVEGPASASVVLPTAVPGAVAASTDPVDGVTRLVWPAVAGTTGYEVRLYRAGASVGAPVVVTDSAWDLPEPLAPFAELAVTVAAVTVVRPSGVTVIGPAGPRCSLPTVRPGPGAASYDAVDATVTWGPAAGALGYQVSILSNGTVVAHASVGATATTATLPVADGLAAAGYVAVVQARTDTGTGPAADPVLLLTPALFLSTASARLEQPHLYSAVHPGSPAGDLTAALPDLGFTDPAGSLPIRKGSFVLAAAASYPYELTVLADSDAWSFGVDAPAKRQAVRDAYKALLVAAEAAGANGAALFTLMNAVARILPQTFTETLYYAAGFDASTRTVDLRPGLVLRVAPANFLTVAMSAEWTNGYVGGPVFEFDVGGYLDYAGQWRNGFDPFIARLAAAGALDVPGPYAAGRNQSGIASAADLFAPGLRKPYHRLFAPGVLENPTGPGSVQVGTNFVITAAGKYADLVNIANPVAGESSGYFRGRAVITPCARIVVNGAATTVPLGTTLGGLLDGYASRPIGGGRISGLTLDRPNGPAFLDRGVLSMRGGAVDPVAVGAYRAVRLDWGSLPNYGGGLDALALPLLPGDRIGFDA